MPDHDHQHHSYVCSDARCVFSTGVVGITAMDLEFRSRRAAEAKDGVPPEVLPCPECAETVPPREGTLLAIPKSKHTEAGKVVAARFGSLAYWSVAAPVGMLAASARRALDFSPEEATKTKPTPPPPPPTTTTPPPAPPTMFTAGPKVVTGVVLRTLPFDGHVLAFGNQDAFVKAGWEPAEARYGHRNEPPSTAAAATPTYIRELQKDLVLLGYFSKSRTPTEKLAGRFEVHTLGSVLAFKRDLVDIYEISVTDTPVSITPRDIEPESFSQPIHYQSTFVAPALLLREWDESLSSKAGVTGRPSSIRTALNRKGGKPPKLNKRLRGIVEDEIGKIAASMDALPFRFVLENVTEPYAPFEQKPATKPVADLIVPTTAPAHATVKALFSDPVFEIKGMNTRDKNLENTKGHAENVVATARTGSKVCSHVLEDLDQLAPDADEEAAWAAIDADLRSIVAVAKRFFDLVEFFVLNISTQIEPWLDHIKTIGAVDQPTAVYLKALREGARIGPLRRAGYRLALNPGDFGGMDSGGTYIRDTCRSRGDNRGKSKASTMPEILVLQFLGNESGMTFTSSLPPLNLDATDKKIRFPKLGVDTVSPYKGTFDPVCTTAGEWVHARGWGVGQATEKDIKLDGVQLRRGLPVLKPGDDVVTHPKSFADKDASFSSALDRKAIARFNQRDGRRNCSYGDIRRPYYDCHGCVKRFYDQEWVSDRNDRAGGVIVPRAKGTFGLLSGASGFWLDLERFSGFARASGQGIDHTASRMYEDLFGVRVTILDPSSEADSAVIEALSESGSIERRVAAVAKARSLDNEAKGALTRRIVEHIDERRDLPCSWWHVRIGYAGSGPQAFGSLFKMLRVVGKLDCNDTVAKHIKEASALRIKEHEEGGGG